MNTGNNQATLTSHQERSGEDASLPIVEVT
jgi:hypothetical protein